MTKLSLSKCKGKLESKRALIKFLPSNPVLLWPSSVVFFKETCLKGVFGCLSLVKIVTLDNLVAAQKVISLESSTIMDIAVEAKVMHALSGHPRFPYCFGIIKPNIIICQYLGEFSEEGEVIVNTIQKVIGSGKLNKYWWVSICNQIVECVMFMHGLGILHNDIKSDIILYGSSLTDVKIIDFGKATLTSNPVEYNLNASDVKKYNVKHRYLAHELRNVACSKQTVLTDVYSIGYVIKYIVYHENISFLYETGRKMKKESPLERMNLEQALLTFKQFLKDIVQ